MSNAVTNACRPLQMPPTAKNVLMALADRAQDDGVAWPSLPGLCEATCFKRTAVIDAIKWLEASGFVAVEKSTGRNNRFTIKLGRLLTELRRLTGAASARKEVVEAIAWLEAQTGTSPGPVREPDQSATRTSPPNVPVRQADATRPADGPPPVREADAPVREADPNHKEPSEQPSEQPPRKSTRARKPAKTTIPDDFVISTRVKTWAAEKGHDRLDAHFEHFAGKARASGYTYVDWDQAFMNAIRDDWAELRKRSGKPASGSGKAFGARGLFEGTNYRQGLNGEDITDAEFRMTSE